MRQALPAIVMVLILAAGLLYFRQSPSEPAEPHSEPGIAGGGGITVVSTGSAVRVVLEADAAAEIAPPVTVVTDVPDASGGKCCYLGPEKVNESAEIKQYTDMGYPGAKHPGYARLRFTVPATANYVVWVRTRWSDDCGDSIDLAIDGEFRGTVQGNARKDDPRWQWFRLGSAQAPLTIHLEKEREHTLTLANREDDLHFDQVLLLDASSTLEPVGIQQP